MRTKTGAALNGISLESLNDAIIIQGIDEPAPAWNTPGMSRGWKTGQRQGKREKRYRDITIRFAIDIISDMEAREQCLQQVREWAEGGGWLTLTYRNRQRIYVYPQTMIAIRGIDKWAEAYQITLRAWEIPEWEYSDPDTLTMDGKSASGTINIRGRGGKMRAEITNSSGSACDTISIKSGGQELAFSGLGLANGETLIIEYTETDLQTITIKGSSGTRSAMGKRTNTSDDDIHLTGGKNTIEISAGASLKWKIYAYGRLSG